MCGILNMKKNKEQTNNYQNLKGIIDILLIASSLQQGYKVVLCDCKKRGNNCAFRNLDSKFLNSKLLSQLKCLVAAV
ncbi:hypothetical protein L1887_26899 [Cichorium endivia]|nr:hypothetical protein L1887_26899 [Cichorium endivia]